MRSFLPEPDPIAEAGLTPLAENITAGRNRAELESRVAPLIETLGERLMTEHFGPARRHALRANELLPASLYRAGLVFLRESDFARAEELLADAAECQELSARRLRTWAATVPSLKADAEAGTRRVWTMWWETGKALRGQGEWRRAHELLTAVLDQVRLDGRCGLVREDLDFVAARIRQEELRQQGRTVMAAMRGLRPASRRAARFGLTPEGVREAAGEALPSARTALTRRTPLPPEETG